MSINPTSVRMQVFVTVHNPGRLCTNRAFYGHPGTNMESAEQPGLFSQHQPIVVPQGHRSGFVRQTAPTHQSLSSLQSRCLSPTHSCLTPTSPRALWFRSSSTSFWLLLRTEEMLEQQW